MVSRIFHLQHFDQLVLFSLPALIFALAVVWASFELSMAGEVHFGSCSQYYDSMTWTATWSSGDPKARIDDSLFCELSVASWEGFLGFTAEDWDWLETQLVLRSSFDQIEWRQEVNCGMSASLLFCSFDGDGGGSWQRFMVWVLWWWWPWILHTVYVVVPSPPGMWCGVKKQRTWSCLSW